MGQEVVKTVLQAGLVEDSTVSELRKWGAPLPQKPEGPEVPAEVVPLAIERAIQDSDFVQIRETDLAILPQYLHTQTTGKLHYELLDGTVGVIDITYGKTRMGEYIIVWDGDNISEEITSGIIHLVVDGAEIYFKDVRELFYGEYKAFIICTPK